MKPNESKILIEAAENGGRVVLPVRLKEVTRQRLAGLFAQHGLTEMIGDTLQLTRADYRAVGLQPPRTRAAASDTGTGEPRVMLRDVVRGLLGREADATLPELVDATGWLPHTTRAALSCLRSGGDTLAKSKRDDGTTSYRLLPAEPVTPTRKAGEAQGEAAAAEIAA